MRKPLTKRPTITDVALLANVSTATVSRALQNPKLVSQKTRKQVFDVVAKTGYRPNTAAKMLRQSRSNTLLVILPDIANPFFAEILSGIEDVATGLKFTILIGNTNGDETRTRDLLSNLQNGRADGALLLNGQLPFEAEEIADFALVSLSEEITNVQVPHVGTDNVAASHDATHHLIDLGHKRIVHFSGPKGNVLTTTRQSGYESAMRKAGLEDYIQIVACGFTFEEGQKSAEALLQTSSIPEAIVCASDIAAMGTISELNRQGHNVPETISVVGFDDISFASLFSPPLTTIRQDRREIGSRATQMLIGLIQGAQDCPDQIVVDHNLVQRSSAIKRSGSFAA